MVVASVLWDMTPSSLVEICWCYTLFLLCRWWQHSPPNYHEVATKLHSITS